MAKREKKWTTKRDLLSGELQLSKPSGDPWHLGDRNATVRRIARLLNEDDARKASKKKVKVKK
jgi:hypothetical protein